MNNKIEERKRDQYGLRNVAPDELQLGDQVTMMSAVRDVDPVLHAFDSSTVIKITPDEVTLFRPYVHHSDTAAGDMDKPNGASIIAYIGTETFSVPRHGSSSRWFVYRRDNNIKL